MKLLLSLRSAPHRQLAAKHLLVFVWSWFFVPGLVGAQEKVTFQEHITPLVDSNCARCHNADKKRGDLDLTSYSGVLAGGASGVVVVAGDPDGSKLHRVMAHLEEPKMPPNKPPLPEKDLAVFKKWIEGGLLETSGSKAVVASRPAVDISVSAAALEKPDGPPPMPPELPLEPVVHSPRANAVLGLASSPWAPVVAFTGQNQVLLYHSDTSGLLGILPFTEGHATAVRFSRNGKLLIAGGGQPGKSGRVQLWNITTGEHMNTLGDEYDTVLACDISPDQRWIATGGPDRIVKIYSTETGALVQRFKKHTDWVLSVEFSPDGKFLATGDRQGGLVIWEVESNQTMFTLVGHKKAVTGLSWRRDAKVLASISEDETVRLWEMKEGQQVKTWTAHKGGGLSVSFAPKGDLATCGRDGAVLLWNSDGRKLRTFEGHQDLPVRVTFSHDGNRVICSDWTGRVHVWNTKQSKPESALDANPPFLAERISKAEADLIAAKTAGDASEVDRAQAELQHWKSAEKFAVLHRARQDLRSIEEEHQKLIDEIDKTDSESDRLKQALLSANTKEEKNNLKQQLSPLQLGAEKAGKRLKDLKRDLKRQTARVEKLSADYDRIKPQTTLKADLR